ncbi:MAG: ribonuclease P protein component [Magnetococcales bacterium]|nr:ribonuclease P protein component [Magnetococcales bacterium]
MKVEEREPELVGLSFPKSARLLTSAEFRRVTGPGRKSVSPYFLLFTTVGEQGSGPRLGMTVSRKVGNAVVRNRIKRTIREFFRKNRGQLVPALSCVVIARPRAGQTANSELTQSLTTLFLPYDAS